MSIRPLRPVYYKAPAATPIQPSAEVASPVQDDSIPEHFKLGSEGKLVKPDANKPISVRPFGRRI